jgi:hypothetical protein
MAAHSGHEWEGGSNAWRLLRLLQPCSASHRVLRRGVRVNLLWCRLCVQKLCSLIGWWWWWSRWTPVGGWMQWWLVGGCRLDSTRGVIENSKLNKC